MNIKLKLETFFSVDGRERQRSHCARGVRVAAIAILMAAPLPAMAAVGELDPLFGSEGQALVSDNLGPHLLELSDGRILVVGEPSSDGAATANHATRVAVSRFLPTGTPDGSFGENGQLFVDLFPEDDRTVIITATAQQSDAKVILAGQYWSQGGQPFVARIDANGAPDLAFGSGGTSEPGTGGTEPFYSGVMIREDGEILAAISDWTSDRIDRFGPDGRPLGNLIRIDFAPARMARQSDGRLIVSGYSRTLHHQGLMRFDLDGTADETFGDDGFAALDDGYSGNLAVEPGTDQIVLCGPALVRFTPDGHLDTTFGVHGTGYVALGNDSVPQFSYCHRLLAMWDGSIVFIGVRTGEAPLGFDRAFVSGLTSSGLADLRFGAGSGASELQLGSIRGSTDWWGDGSSALIATRDGDALLSWMTTDGLRLARIDLDAGSAGETPPSSTPPPPSEPPPQPSASPPVILGSGGSGGGGSLAWVDLALLALASTMRSLLRRRGNTTS